MASDPSSRVGQRGRVRLLARVLAIWVFKLFRVTTRYPKTVLVVTTGVLIYFNILISQMPTYFTMEDTLDPTLPSVAATKMAENKFLSGLPLYITFHSKDGRGLKGAELCKIKEWLSSGLYNLEVPAQIVTVTSPFQLKKTLHLEGIVAFLPLLKPDCDQSLPQPLGGYAHSTKDMAEILAATPWRNLLSVGADGGDLLAEVVLRDEGQRTGYHLPTETALVIDRSLQRLFQDDLNVEWHLAGPASFRAYSKQAADHDLYLNAAIPVVLSIAIYLLYGSWMGGFLIALAIVTMRTLLLGTIALCGGHTDPLAGSLVTLVSLAAIEDFLFVTRYQLRTKLGWRSCYRRFLIPSLLTSLTTVLGFLSLLGAEISTVRNLGVWAAYGAVVQWVVIYLLIPCLQAVWGRAQHWAKEPRFKLDLWGDRLGGYSLPYSLRRLVLPLMGAALLSAPWLTLEDSLEHFFPKSHPSTVASNYLQQTRGWKGAFSVVMSAKMTGQDKEQLIRQLLADPEVVRVAYVKELLDYFTVGLPHQLAAEVTRFVGATDAYDTFRSWQGEEKITIYIRDPSVRKTEAVMALVQKTCPKGQCQAAGTLPVFVDFSHAVSQSLFTSFASSLVIVALFLAFYLWLHKQPHYLAVIVSSMWGPVIMLALMALLRIPVNFVSCFFAAILVGLSGDNAVQYIYAAKQHRSLTAGVHVRAGGSVEITFCMILVALILVNSAYLPPRTLGIVLAAGLMVNLAGDLWVLKLLLPPLPLGLAQTKKEPATKTTEFSRAATVVPFAD